MTQKFVVPATFVQINERLIAQMINSYVPSGQLVVEDVVTDWDDNTLPCERVVKFKTIDDEVFMLIVYRYPILFAPSHRGTSFTVWLDPRF